MQALKVLVIAFVLACCLRAFRRGYRNFSDYMEGEGIVLTIALSVALWFTLNHFQPLWYSSDHLLPFRLADTR